MNLSLIGKNALVGGSSKGIGKAIAIELALLGANVTLVARDANSLQAALADLDTTQGQQHDFLMADYADTMTLRSAVQSITQRKNIHILVNNTGGPSAGAAHTADLNAFINAFQQHLLANQLLMQSVLEGMKKEGYGRIVNVISTSVKQPLDNLGVSNTIRGAVANWAKTLANELAAFGITVNNVLPGATATERLAAIVEKEMTLSGKDEATVKANMVKAIPAGRVGEPHEIAAAVAFLASPAAAYINGINLPVDGGRTKCL